MERSRLERLALDVLQTLAAVQHLPTDTAEGLDRVNAWLRTAGGQIAEVANLADAAARRCRLPPSSK